VMVVRLLCKSIMFYARLHLLERKLKKKEKRSLLLLQKCDGNKCFYYKGYLKGVDECRSELRKIWRK